MEAILEGVLVLARAEQGLERHWCWLRWPAGWGWVGVSLEGLAQVDGLSMVGIQKNTRVGCKVLARLVES